MSTAAGERWWNAAALARHYLAVFWLGGLTFYAAIVVPIGADVTDATAQGFITQRVTRWLNVLGVAYLAATLRDARDKTRRSRPILWWTLVAAQAALVALHPVLGRMLDPATRSVATDGDFYFWHRLYLIVTTVQWAAGIGHVRETWLRDARRAE